MSDLKAWIGIAILALCFAFAVAVDVTPFTDPVDINKRIARCADGLGGRSDSNLLFCAEEMGVHIDL